MATALDREIRKQLDKAVRRARIVAEDGARKALTELGVEDARKPDGLSREKADLRNRLRAHAQSLGDVKAPNDSIRANRLVREIAYEHWHRALFARFLAENNLLIDPDHKVPVSLSELEQIAKEEGRDLVELAADWAEPMLPQIFRKDDPVLALALPPETKAGIAEIVKDLPRAVFAADDSLGWVYQFWQADQKDRVNESEVKIGADELPAVTQLFTEDYMVLFLLENTLGAWWAAKVLAADPELASSAESEDELRDRTSPPGYRWTYLRFVREPREGETHETAIGRWWPAAGTFESWPGAARNITVLDPCMGSGHFLVFALPILVAFRRAEERLDERSAVKAVLAENLFGLEIDARCTQLAAFALALASWKRLRGPEQLPLLNLACSGLAIGVTKAEWLKPALRAAELADPGAKRDIFGLEKNLITSGISERIRNGLERLHNLFAKAPWLGSLIDPRRVGGDILTAEFSQVEPLLAPILSASGNDEIAETVVAAQGMAKAAELLGRQYVLVATNVPYLGRPDQSDIIRKYCDQAYHDAKADIATCFIERSLAFLRPGGTCAIVVTQSWRFQHRYKSFRKRLLQERRWHLLAGLGPRAFEAISGEQVNVCLLTLGSRAAQEKDVFFGLDLSDLQGPPQKKQGLVEHKLLASTAEAQLGNPDHRVSLDITASKELLSRYATCIQGLATSDDPQFVRFFWELNRLSDSWEPLCGTVDETVHYGGRERIIHWESGTGRYYRHAVALKAEGRLGGWKSGTEARGKRGVLISQMSTMPVTLYTGEFYDHSASVLIPRNIDDLPAIWAYASSEEFLTDVRKLDKSLKPSNNVFVQTPFDADRWRDVAVKEYPSGLPRPYSDDPTQWLFGGQIKEMQHVLQVAVARLLGYRWPLQTGSSFMDCAVTTEPDEVARSGLVDAEGIVPLPALAGKADASTRLRELIRVVWGPNYAEGTIRDLLAAEEAGTNDLSTWLADAFFEGHCKLYHQTPFVWHVWDGVRGGFSALINYHRLCEGNGAGRRLLEKLRDTYLGEWIATQRRANAAGEAGAEERLIAAEHLRGELTNIIDGDPPYDLFVRWKPLEQQAVGWEPDIDDGVRLNIRPFLRAQPKNSRNRDACILRINPRVKKHAGADAGKEPQRESKHFPWFWAEDDNVATFDFIGGPVFKGRRYNDFHYTRDFKQRARDAKANAARGVA